MIPVELTKRKWKHDTSIFLISMKIKIQYKSLFETFNLFLKESLIKLSLE